ncbi:endonuclease/exonuclease/phosphatase family protein [Streptomyces triticirhizae]|uniref:Endonuclease/exonuclease/phosphatase n=1 Tax=Streptomyces triticirhizae TaxID=2483353 RepID=A0A3M2LN61_9ACTN|nr:endonuclease/exonuclease/phosphatase family protein [Streptomyces triticirhizae]RMI38802.1 endonuclease/exonuclease/phosphatase [Streptomyces triticirhizae]
MTRVGTLDVLTFNLNNPSVERAERQLAYLAARPEHVLVLTETADSGGCAFLEERFTAAGYSVTFPRPEQRGERGAMIVSRLATRPLETGVDYLPHRAVGVTVDTDEGPLDVIGLYVPSRNGTPEKTERKRTFLQACRSELAAGAGGARLVIGDFNVLEPAHVPRYRFFSPFEYEFYDWFAAAGYSDAFRAVHPEALEYSWVGKTGDGYRYDHAFVSGRLASELRGCSYVHEPRTMTGRLTDHSALTVGLATTAVALLAVADPTRAEGPAPALF